MKAIKQAKGKIQLKPIEFSEIFEVEVKKANDTSGRIYLPAKYIGKKVFVLIGNKKRKDSMKSILFFMLSLLIVLIVVKALSITFQGQTPANNSYQNYNWVFVNVSVTDDNDTYAFINWQDSLVLWMRMDDVNQTGTGALVYDNSSYGNNGTAKGNAVQTDLGYYGKGYNFSSVGDYINITPSQSLNLSWNFTICAWINPRASSSGHFIFKRGINNNLNPRHQYELRLNASQFIVFRRGDGISSSESAKSSYSIPLNQWHHVCGEVNGSNQMLVYHNGTDVTQSAVTATLTWQNFTDFQAIGVLRSTSDVSNMTVDEVMVFNRSLSLEEIQSLYNSSKYYLSHNFTNLADQTYTYRAYSIDRDGNVGSTEQRNVTIDTILPQIQFVNPTNQTGVTVYRNYIEVNVTSTDETKLDTIKINLYNSTRSLINTSYSQASPHYINFSNLLRGVYYYNATANDSAGNINSTETRNITINLGPTINFNASVPSSPVENDNVYIYANVTDANPVQWVNFTVIAPNGTIIINNQNASSKEGDTWNSSVFKATSIGVWAWNITSFNGFAMSSTRGSFTISLWHTIVGNLSGSLVLSDSAGSSLVNWQVQNTSGSNLYVADSDSSINFNSLLALGRNTTNTTKFEDFSELDQVLGTSNFSDSVNNTFTSGGTVIQEYNFTIFSNLVYFVPIVNSTNSSLFFTGIMWDSSDDNSSGQNPKQYDSNDREDIVFVTQVNNPAQGKYGFYGYEIKVPASLRSYVSSGGQFSVALYGEIR